MTLSKPLARKVYIKNLVSEFDLHPGQCLKLLKSCYGLCHAEDLWISTLDKHHSKKLEMRLSKTDPAL